MLGPDVMNAATGRDEGGKLLWRVAAIHDLDRDLGGHLDKAGTVHDVLLQVVL